MQVTKAIHYVVEGSALVKALRCVFLHALEGLDAVNLYANVIDRSRVGVFRTLGIDMAVGPTALIASLQCRTLPKRLCSSCPRLVRRRLCRCVWPYGTLGRLC